MLRYEKPEVILTNDMAEGVYAASGAKFDPLKHAGCDSIYIKGVYHQPNFINWQSGTNIDGRGCEGCPACWSDGRCHISNYGPGEDCRPTWEKHGKLPSDKWNCS